MLARTVGGRRKMIPVSITVCCANGEYHTYTHNRSVCASNTAAFSHRSMNVMYIACNNSIYLLLCFFVFFIFTACLLPCKSFIWIEVQFDEGRYAIWMADGKCKYRWWRDSCEIAHYKSGFVMNDSFCRFIFSGKSELFLIQIADAPKTIASSLWR